MPVIADHLQPGSWRYELDQKLGGDRQGFVPSEAWPEDCMVQWGGSGVVLGKNPYRTAFFEAFPQDPRTFIRGEGATIADAEADALKRWARIVACPGHEYETRGYRNGLGFCKHCSLQTSDVFHWPCRECGEQTCYSWVEGKEEWLCKTCFPSTPEGRESATNMARWFADEEESAEAQP